jgi:hypothetical protein
MNKGSKLKTDGKTFSTVHWKKPLKIFSKHIATIRKTEEIFSPNGALFFPILYSITYQKT